MFSYKNLIIVLHLLFLYFFCVPSSLANDVCIENGGAMVCSAPEIGRWQYGSAWSSGNFSGWTLQTEEDAIAYLQRQKPANPACQTANSFILGGFQGFKLSDGSLGSAIAKVLGAYPRMDESVSWDFTRIETCPAYIYGDPGVTYIGYIGKIRDVKCPVGYANSENNEYCVRPQASCNCHVGDGLNPITGEKINVEEDYVGEGEFPLEFTRIFSSQSAYFPLDSQEYVVGPIGNYWHHTYDRSVLLPVSTNEVLAIVKDEIGNLTYFGLDGKEIFNDSAEKSTIIKNSDSEGVLNGWTRVFSSGTVENYNAQGKLISIINRAGRSQTLEYNSNGLLIAVKDAFGRTLSFNYDLSGKMNSVIAPDGGIYSFLYDENDNLTSVVYPDEKIRLYKYEDSNFKNALTGIVDENNNNFKNFSYDSSGRTVSSGNLSGISSYSYSYPVPYISAKVANALGNSNIYAFSNVVGIYKNNTLTHPDGSVETINYDVNGNIESRTDFRGISTAYTYDLARNYETSRVNGTGTAQEGTTTTLWHASYQLPLKIAEPLMLATFDYDGAGNLLTKTLQSSNDASGSLGFSATVVGIQRKWTYTYNAVGQVLTAIGPRTDISDVTSYAYDSMGNLITVTNGAGQVTTLSNYDANGRVGRIAAPNGVTTDLTYTPRGWLSSRVATSGSVVETTTYAYDGVGQLVKVTLPDTSSIDYTYDDAHRLTAINDSLGNSIHYTLDLVGNRVGEQVADSGGTLAQQVSRVYDELNRLQQQTGIVQ